MPQVMVDLSDERLEFMFMPFDWGGSSLCDFLLSRIGYINYPIILIRTGRPYLWW